MPTHNPTHDRLTLPLPEAARLLGVHPMTLRRAVYRGELRAIVLGRKLLIPREAFEELAAGTTLTVDAPAPTSPRGTP